MFVKTAPLAVIFTIVYGFLFSLYNLFLCPIMDSRPYHVGANIPGQMQWTRKRVTCWKPFLFYSKEGRAEFTEENLPWEDSTWTYVDAKRGWVGG